MDSIETRKIITAYLTIIFNYYYAINLNKMATN